MIEPVRKSRREAARHYRSLGLICRQQAARHPEASWRWLSEAERWEDLAVREREAAGAAPISGTVEMLPTPPVRPFASSPRAQVA